MEWSTKKLGTIILVVLWVFVSPAVLVNTLNGYVNTEDTTAICQGCGPSASEGMGHRLKTNEEAIRIINDILVNLTGYDASSLTAIMEDYNVNIARPINTVVLSKVMNRSPDEAASIVSQGDLRTYIEDNNIINNFTSIRQSYALEISKARGGVKLGNRRRYSNGICGCRKNR